MFSLRRLSTLRCKTLRGWNPNAAFASATGLIDQQVAAGVPSLAWNADALHGLSEEQIEFRANVRQFAEKELPAELVGKVRGTLLD